MTRDEELANVASLRLDPRVIVTFTRGSTKDGPVGHHVHVTEGADQAEAQRVFNLAVALHEAAQRVDAGEQDIEIVLPVDLRGLMNDPEALETRAAAIRANYTAAEVAVGDG